MSRKRRKRRKQRRQDPFDFVIDVPRIEVPKIEIPKIEIPEVEIPVAPFDEPRRYRKKPRKHGRSGKPQRSSLNSTVGIPRIKTKIEVPKIEVPEIEVPEIEIPEIETPAPLVKEEREPSPHQLSKIQLVSILARRLSDDQIYRALIALGRQRLAQNFINEVQLVNRKYQKMIQEVEGKVKESIDAKVLSLVVNELLSHMRRLYQLSFTPIDELDFHKQIEPFLNGVVSGMEDSLSRFGLEVKVYREFELPMKERVDLLVSIGSARIGIEVKYDLNETSKLQRLLGQIDMYLPHLDYLIVVSYMPVDMRAIQMIKSKEMEKEKPIRIVTPNQIF